MNAHYIRALCLASVVALAACSGGGGGRQHRDYDYRPSAVKIGKPYTVMGETYEPKVQLDYDETGMASWYGPGFHGKYTANGERFDSKSITAAHPTLPLPSMVRVTDLLTGRSIIARVNDRGPFSKKRIIDLSEGSARELGIKARGLAQVRVQFLPEETEQYLASISTPERKVEYPVPLSRSQAAEVQVADASAGGTSWRGEPAYADINESRNVAAIAPVAPVEQAELVPARPSDERLDVRPMRLPAQEVMRENDASAEPLQVALEGDEQVRPLQGIEQQPIIARPAIDMARREPMTREALPERMPFARAIPPNAPYRPDGAPTRERMREAVTPTQGDLYVQAGSFSIPENAEHLATRLQRMGPTSVTQQQRGDKNWYRVRVGPLKQVAQAQDVLQDINALGIADAKIIQD